MRVVQYKDGTTGMEVKVDGSYRPITGNEKFIKDLGPDARAAFDTYMQHQRDLFQQ